MNPIKWNQYDIKYTYTYKHQYFPFVPNANLTELLRKIFHLEKEPGLEFEVDNAHIIILMNLDCVKPDGRVVRTFTIYSSDRDVNWSRLKLKLEQKILELS